MAHYFTKEQLLLQALWRKAAREGEVEIKLKSKSDATRLRFNLYNAVRLVREGKVVDEELRAATEGCSISLEGEVLTIRQKSRTATFQAIAGLLGEEGLAEALAAAPSVSADTGGAAEASELAAMRERLAKEFADKPAERTAPRVTPYYTREE